MLSCSEREWHVVDKSRKNRNLVANDLDTGPGSVMRISKLIPEQTHHRHNHVLKRCIRTTPVRQLGEGFPRSIPHRQVTSWRGERASHSPAARPRSTSCHHCRHGEPLLWLSRRFAAVKASRVSKTSASPHPRAETSLAWLAWLQKGARWQPERSGTM